MSSQPFALACQGGLNKVASQFELLRSPGEATSLRNFEVSTNGGYRRIKRRANPLSLSIKGLGNRMLL